MAIASAVAAAGGAAKTGYDIANPPSAPKLPTPTPGPAGTTATARAGLPGAKADAAARTGGGISPEFLANLLGQETGQPGAGLDILSEIRASLGQQGPQAS